MSESDKELVARAKAGSTAAFDELIAMHQDRVFALAYRMLGNREDAADIQQETFIRAWRSLRKFRAEARFSTWLHRITMNLCLSRKRRKAIEVPIEPFMSEVTGGVGCIRRTEAAMVVREVLAEMRPKERALIVLREIEGRSFDEIAEVLGCTINSARTLASRARKQLREKMRPYLAEEEV